MNAKRQLPSEETRMSDALDAVVVDMWFDYYDAHIQDGTWVGEKPVFFPVMRQGMGIDPHAPRTWQIECSHGVRGKPYSMVAFAVDGRKMFGDIVPSCHACQDKAYAWCVAASGWRDSQGCARPRRSEGAKAPMVGSEVVDHGPPRSRWISTMISGEVQ